MYYKSKNSIPLATYLSDLEGGPLSYYGSYSFVPNGPGSSYSGSIPQGIISWSPLDTLVITSTSKYDVGTYTFTVTAKDGQPLTSASASFTLKISNTAPKLATTAPPDVNLAHK